MSTLLRASSEPEAGFEIGGVVSSRAEAGGIAKARAAGVRSAVVDPRSFASTESFNRALWDEIGTFQVGGVMLLGWLPKLRIPPTWQGRAINAHPALLPWFGGKGMWGRHVHESVLASGMKVTGFTFHYVDDDYDHGAIVQQVALPIEDGDTAEKIETRVIAAQHEAIVPLVRAWASGRFRCEGSRVVGAPVGWRSTLIAS